MAINSSTKKVVSKKLIKSLGTKVQTSVLVDEQSGVENVLNAVCWPSVVSAEMLGEHLQIFGKCDLEVCFTDKDKNYQTAKEVTEFSERTQLGSFENVSVVPALKNVQTKKAGNNLIDVIASIELSVYGVMVEEITPIETSNQDCVEKTEKLSLQSLSACASERFEISEEMEVLGTVDKVLFSSGRVLAFKTTPMDNYAKIEGSVEIETVCLMGGTVKRTTQNVDFVQEVSVLNLKPSDVVDDSLVLELVELSANASQDQSKTILTASLKMQAHIYAFVQNEIEVVSDLFSLKKQLSFSTQCFNNEKFVKKISFAERLNLSVDMKDAKRMDEIIFVGKPEVSVSQTLLDQDGVQVSGSIMQNIVYKNYDVEDVLSTKLEIPFACLCALAEDVKDAEFLFDIKCNSFKNKVGKEIDFNYELAYEAKVYEKNYDCYVSKAEELEDLAQNENSIIIYRPQAGDDLYEISKELRVSPDIILSQNPNYEEGQENSKVVVYLQKK